MACGVTQPTHNNSILLPTVTVHCRAQYTEYSVNSAVPMSLSHLLNNNINNPPDLYTRGYLMLIVMIIISVLIQQFNAILLHKTALPRTTDGHSSFFALLSVIFFKIPRDYSYQGY